MIRITDISCSYMAAPNASGAVATPVVADPRASMGSTATHNLSGAQGAVAVNAGPEPYAVRLHRNPLGPVTVEQAIRSFLQNWQVRPNIMQIIGLVASGMTQAHVENAAASLKYPLPDMSVTYTELVNLMPYVDLIIDHLCRFYPGVNLLIPGRDGDFLYDALKVRNALGSPLSVGDIVNFPGSSELWTEGFPLLAPEKKKSFLATCGVDEAALATDRRWMILDTGFFGSVGKRFHELIHEAYPKLPIPEISRRFLVKVVSTGCPPHDGAYAEELLPFDERVDEAFYRSMKAKFPRTGKIWHYNYKLMPDFFPDMVGINFVNLLVATSMQLLPKFHDHFSSFCESGLAVPRRFVEPDENIDWMGRTERTNANIIHPVAAILVQLWIINSMARI